MYNKQSFTGNLSGSPYLPNCVVNILSDTHYCFVKLCPTEGVYDGIPVVPFVLTPFSIQADCFLWSYCR